jgi:succinyl-diaminopimelate desuccinylase
MNIFHKITDTIDSFRNSMIDMQIKLCSFPAISPSSGGEGESKKAEFLLEFLKDGGFANIEVIKAPDLDSPSGDRPNILATYKGKKSLKKIWIMTHMDIVPPGESAQWEGNPFEAWTKEGKIFGRGVEDNQQDMVASLFALKAFQTHGVLPTYDVGIALVADEETGSDKGITYVLNQTKAFSKQDLIIVPDTGNEDGTMIEVSEKSILWLKFTAHGKQAHGSTPEKGIQPNSAPLFHPGCGGQNKRNDRTHRKGFWCDHHHGRRAESPGCSPHLTRCTSRPGVEKGCQRYLWAGG